MKPAFGAMSATDMPFDVPTSWRKSARHCALGMRNGTHVAHDGQYTWESALGKVHLGKYTHGKVHLGKYTQEGTPENVHRKRPIALLLFASASELGQAEQAPP